MYDENSNAAASALGTSTSSSGLMSQLLNVKDSRWLQLEVCREFQRGQCSRSDLECKFAHPPPHVDVQNGRVTACYDSIKGRCTRENPKCKYLHPPQHLKDQLLINGRNNLALKNLICTQLNQSAATPTLSTINPLAQLVVSGQASPALTDPLLLVQQQQQQAAAAQAATLMPAALPYQYYQGLTTMYPAVMPVASSEAYQAQVQAQLAALQSLAAMSQPTVSLAPAALSTTTTLGTSRKRALEEEPSAGTSIQHIDQNSLLLAAAAAAGAVPCKRPAVDNKNAVPVYANGAAATQISQIPQPTFNPYLVPALHGYMPAVSFSGQIPPRF